MISHLTHTNASSITLSVDFDFYGADYSCHVKNWVDSHEDASSSDFLTEVDQLSGGFLLILNDFYAKIAFFRSNR